MDKLEDIEARWKKCMEYRPLLSPVGYGNTKKPLEETMLEEDIPALIEMVRALRRVLGRDAL